jgi:hypothetical protein
MSRSQVFKLEPPLMKDVAVYVKNILDKENIKYSMPDIASVTKDFYPDVRKIVNFLQQSSTSGTLKLVATQSANVDLKNKIILSLKNCKANPKAFNEIRQMVNDSGIKMFEELYTELYDRAEEFASGKEINVIIEVSESIYQSAMVVDKEITFMACIAKLIKVISK